MIIEQIVGNIHSTDTGTRHKEKVYLKSDALLKRIQRVTTDHGREIGLQLKRNEQLTPGDILYMDTKNVIYVDVLPEKVLVIRPDTLQAMGTLAHQIGNRHIPAQFESDSMIVGYDYLLEELIASLGVSYKVENRQLREAFRPIGHD